MVKSNNMIKNCILIMFIFFSINIVSGNVNIIFQSDNEKLVRIYDLDNNYNITQTNYSNYTFSLPYNNYIIKLYPTNTHLNGSNGSFIIENLRSFNNDVENFLWIVVIIILVYCGLYLLDKKT